MMLFVYRGSRLTRLVTSKAGSLKSRNSKRSSKNALTLLKIPESNNRLISSNVLMSKWSPLNKSANWRENAKLNFRKMLMR